MSDRAGNRAVGPLSNLPTAEGALAGGEIERGMEGSLVLENGGEPSSGTIASGLTELCDRILRLHQEAEQLARKRLPVPESLCLALRCLAGDVERHIQQAGLYRLAQQQNPAVQKFFDAHLIIQADGKVLTETLWKAFEAWAEAEGALVFRGTLGKELRAWLRLRGVPEARLLDLMGREGRRETGSGRRREFYRGIVLRASV